MSGPTHVSASALALILLASGGQAAADTPAAPTTTSDSQAVATVDRFRELFPQTRHWFNIVSGGQFELSPEGRRVPIYKTLTHRRVRRKDNAGHWIVPHYPATFERPLRIQSSHNDAIYVEITPQSAAPVKAAAVDGLIVYAEAYPATDVIYKSTPTHTDEYLLLRGRQAPTTWRYRIQRGPAITSIRQAGQSIEAVDKRGVAWLRAARPFAIDQRGTRVNGSIKVQGDLLVLSIDTDKLKYPVLVDPDWRPTGDMAHGRFYMGANLLPDGRLMTTGGCSATTCSGDLSLARCPVIVAAAEALDLESRTWSQVGDTTVPRFFHSAETLPDGSVMLAGGCANAACDNPTSSIELYNPTADEFTMAAAMGEARAGMASIVLSNNRVLLAGGCNDTECSRRVEIYDPTTQAIARVADLGTARGRATITLLADGRVLVAGGCTNIGCTTVLASAEVYDPTNDTWTTTTNTMSTPRGGHYAARLDDGQVLIGGGCAQQDCATVLDSAELLDPSTLQFTSTGTQQEPRLGAVALTLPDGVVLISQGCTTSDCKLSNELYENGTFTMGDPSLTTRGFHEVLVHLERRMVIAVGGCQPGTCSWWNETWDITDRLDLPDGGPTDAGILMPPDAATPDAGGPGLVRPTGGCKCRTAGGTTGTAAPILTGLVALVCWRRRRRK